jgi:AraC family transcriptional regulator of adaptative response/methylated-DNA-[protein]-cysteine methyltransferase
MTPTTQEMERAILKRDISYDGIFFVGVRTTGIFCRPSCAARKPLMENVIFFTSVREALFAGYRPCLRCRPLAVSGEPPEFVQTLLNRIETAPQNRIKDSDLREMGIEPEKLRRYFLKHYGMTFQAYSRAKRLGEAFHQIRGGVSIDDVAFESGYDSHSGFRDAFFKTFGKPPGESRSEDCIFLAWIESPIGPLLAGANLSGVCLLEFTERRMLEKQFMELKKRFRCPMIPGNNDHLEQLQHQLKKYFERTLHNFSVPLIFPGTPFEERVWNLLLEIPYGQTRSYEDLAQRLGLPGAARAVGSANGRNRIAIVIPCHRVVNKSGKLGGYGGGLWRKQFLLNLEFETVDGGRATGAPLQANRAALLD